MNMKDQNDTLAQTDSEHDALDENQLDEVSGGVTGGIWSGQQINRKEMQEKIAEAMRRAQNK